jgi:predicted nucleic acid-binding protein
VISYDTNVLIYALEGHSQFQAAAQAVVRQGERGGAVLSVIIKQEILTGAALRGRAAYDAAVQAIGLLRKARFVSVDDAVARLAAELTLRHGRKIIGYDALHVATALRAGADEFWTNDKALAKVKVDGLKICLLADLSREV